MSDKKLRCVLITIGSAGDVHPFVGLGLALKRLGHEVVVATGTYFEPLITKAGLQFEQLFDSDHYRSMLDDPDLWHKFRGAKFVIENAIVPIIRPAYEMVQRLNDPQRTVIAASTLVFGARAAQEKFGVPTATIHLQPCMIRSSVCPAKLPGMWTADWLPRRWIAAQYWLADRLVVDRILEPGWNGFRREVGLPPSRSAFGDSLHSPDLTIGMFPEWFAPSQPDWPRQVRLTGFPLYDERELTPLDDDLERFLAEGEPPIAFTAGSAMTHGHTFFAAAAQGCAKFGRRGLLITKFPEQLPTALPTGVRHVDYAPFSRLFPRCAAVVHHGGVGSTAQSFAAGVPQLVVPMAHDQFDNAHRVMRLGTGLSVTRRAFDKGAGAPILETLIREPSFRACGRRYAEKLAANTALDDTAELIAGLVPAR